MEEVNRNQIVIITSTSFKALEDAPIPTELPEHAPEILYWKGRTQRLSRGSSHQISLLHRSESDGECFPLLTVRLKERFVRNLVQHLSLSFRMQEPA